MSSPAVQIVLRLIHIGAGVFWAGSVFFIARFLAPSVRAIGPAGGLLMQQLTQVRKLPVFLTAATHLTILSGLGLYWNDSAGFSSHWLGSPSGITYGTGAVLAVVAAAIGMTVNSPTARRLGQLGAAIQASGAPPTPEQRAQVDALQQKLSAATQAVALLVALTLVTMAVARYLA